MKTMFDKVARISLPAVGLSLMFVAMSSSAFATPVPEVDPGSVGSALTLLASGAFLLSAKSRKA